MMAASFMVEWASCRRADGGVAGLQAQDGAVDGDVGAGFVDDADHAHRYPNLAQVKAAGRLEALNLGADRIGQFSHLADAFGHAGDAFGGKGEPLGHRAGQPECGCGLEVQGVGFQDRIGCSDEFVRQQTQKAVFGVAG